MWAVLSLMALALLAGAHFCVHGLARHFIGRAVGVRGTGPGLQIVDQDAYRASPAKARFVAAAAGPIANYALCALCFLAGILLEGARETTLQVDVVPSGPAALAGLRDGDRIVGIDGKRVAVFSEVVGRVKERGAGPVQLDIDRAGRPLRFAVQLRDGKLGVMARSERGPVPLLDATIAAAMAPAQALVAVFNQLVNEQQPAFSGPVGIVSGAGVAKSDPRGQAADLLLVLSLYGARAWPVSIVVAFLCNRARSWRRRPDASAL